MLQAPPFSQGLRPEARNQTPYSLPSPYSTNTLFSLQEAQTFGLCFVLLGFPGGSAGKEPPAMRETWAGSLGWEGPLEKGTATHSSILAWRIPWTV